MNNENQLDSMVGDPLDFLSPRLREILRRLAKSDRRDEIQELVWILEAFARGRLRDQGDVQITPRVSLDGLPETVLVEMTRVRRVRPSSAEVDSLHLHAEEPASTVPPVSSHPPRGSDE